MSDIKCFKCQHVAHQITFCEIGPLCINCRAQSLNNINSNTITLLMLLKKIRVTINPNHPKSIYINGIKVGHLNQEIVVFGTYEIGIGKYRTITVEFVDEKTNTSNSG